MCNIQNMLNSCENREELISYIEKSNEKISPSGVSREVRERLSRELVLGSRGASDIRQDGHARFAIDVFTSRICKR